MRRRVVVAALVCGGALLTGCHDGLEQAPVEIQGRWVTDDAVYGDTSFEIGPAHLTIDLGPELGAATHPLDRIEVEDVAGLTHYRLFHMNREGAEDALRIVYSEDPAPLVRLENRRTVHWRRATEER